MDWHHVIEGVITAYGAWSTWRARVHKQAAAAAKAEAARTKSDLERISAEANRLRAAQDLAEQARAARAAKK